MDVKPNALQEKTLNRLPWDGHAIDLMIAASLLIIMRRLQPSSRGGRDGGGGVGGRGGGGAGVARSFGRKMLASAF